MINILIILISIIICVVLQLVTKKVCVDKQAKDEVINKTQKALSITLFLVFMVRLFSSDVFDSVQALQTEMFSSGIAFCVVLLRFVTQGALLITILAPFYKLPTIDNLLAYFAPIVALLNAIFFNVNMQAFVGETYSVLSVRGIQFAIETALMLTIGLNALVAKLRHRPQFKWQKLCKAMVACLFLSLLVMQTATLQNLFGITDIEPREFVFAHRIFIYIGFATPVILYALFRSKEYQARDFVCTSIAVGGFISYFYRYSWPLQLGGLPLHLCNMAMILMFVSFVFKSKKFFYFNYFVNVIGALFAILLPDTAATLFSVDLMNFWYNHWIAFFLPILGVALHLFPRPNIKMIRNSIVVFSAYFLLVMCANSVFPNWGANTDYFFLQGTFIIDKLPFLLPLRENFTYVLEFWGLKCVVYPLYWATIYVGYIAIMFLMWIGYDYCYRVSDHHYELLMRKRRAKVDMLNLQNELNYKEQRKQTNAEDKAMIKITNFTKIYGNGTVKAVDDFNLEVNEGEVFGFLGHNGAGKSTTIKSLVGIQSITKGKMEVCGYDITLQPLKAKLNIGYVPDNHAVYERLTGREYINYVADLYAVSQEDREANLKYYLSLFKLEDAIDRQIKGYSHGMKQKVTVIAALIHNPKVWVLDEPLTGLDPTSAWQIKECMRQHANKGNVVFFSSHVIEVVEKICDRIAIISKGKLQCVYSMAELRAKNISLEELYLQYIEGADALKKEKEEITKAVKA